jgi:NAD(P)-dependent dehydrogenase (short-subunit alcohol dehydrogenase family)
MDMTAAPTVLLTGATSGIGLETARRLALAGSTVILHGPDQVAVDRAIARLVHDGADPTHLTGWAADFARLGEVRAMAYRLRDAHRHIDVLINNAAVLPPSRRQATEDGNELVLQVNYLAPFLLTRLLADRIAAAPAGRMIAVSSTLHRTAVFRWADPQRTKGYSPVGVYAQAKLALAMFARTLAMKEPRIASVSVHPGIAEGGLLPLYGPNGGPVGEAAAALLHLCAPRLDIITGAFYDRFAVAATGPAVEDRGALDQLWKLSSQLVGLDRAPVAIRT